MRRAVVFPNIHCGGGTFPRSKSSSQHLLNQCVQLSVDISRFTANMASTSTIASYDSPPVNGQIKSPYGSRLLPQVVDELARSNPNRVYATLSLSSDLTQGFCNVTMLQVSQAVNRCAYWLEHTVGRSTVFETLSYIGLSDLRYAIVFLAAVKCGYKVRRSAFEMSEGSCA